MAGAQHSTWPGGALSEYEAMISAVTASHGHGSKGATEPPSIDWLAQLPSRGPYPSLDKYKVILQTPSRRAF